MVTNTNQSSEAPSAVWTDKLKKHFSGASCLITGGAGTIGSNVARVLADMEATITVVDNLSSGDRRTLKNLGRPINFIQGDIQDDDVLNQAMHVKPDYVFHLAAHFANQNSVDHPVEDALTNAVGTLKLLERTRRISSLKSFVYASSSCVLGASKTQLSEQSAFHVETPYGVSKLTGELYSKIYHHLHDIPTSVVRYFNVWGPGDRPGQYRNVLPNFITKALRNEDIVITGTGEETREFVYVLDAVQCTLLASSSSDAIGRTFNVGSGDILSVRSLADTIVDATKSQSQIKLTPRREWDGIAHRSTSSARARELLGYLPQHTVKTKLNETVNWLRDYLRTEKA